MKKIIGGTLLAVLTFVFVATGYVYAVEGNDFRIVQRDPFNSSDLDIDVTPPTDVASVFGYKPGGNEFAFFKLGDSLRLTTGILDVDSIATTSIDGLDLVISNLQSGFTSTLSGKANTSHTHTISNVTGLQSALDTVFTQKQADWATTSTSSVTYIKNKPSLATVATSGSYNDLTNKPTLGISYEGTTQRTSSFPIFKSATVSGGTAVVHLTTDGTSGGTTLCTNGVIQDSVSVIFNDNSASYQQSWAFSNSNKTLTVTANKFTTANILSGILGQAQANGSVAKISVWCY